jgi:DNA-binding response OmpR family regulator
VTVRPLILCADDDTDILSLVALRLERAGFDVLRAADGETAIQAVCERRPVLAILDVMMPRLSGYDVLGRIRRDPSLDRMKVVMLSARVQDSDVEHGLAAGADAFLAKPFKAPELVATVQQLLGASRQTS